jgi:16S rRNA pseudouridine516 synthase
MRLDKYISENTAYSRSQTKELIIKGKVFVNGIKVIKTDLQINEDIDEIVVGTDLVEHYKEYYIIMNKPKDTISTTDLTVKNSIMYLLEEKIRKRVFPVGRLDKDTTGLILLTSDGDFNHALMAPKRKINKKYRVIVDKALKYELIKKIESGIDIGGYITKEAKLEILSEFECLLSIQEGKFHQVKRMFDTLDYKVIELHRESIGLLKLDSDLKPGQYRMLTQKEKEMSLQME